MIRQWKYLTQVVTPANEWWGFWTLPTFYGEFKSLESKYIWRDYENCFDCPIPLPMNLRLHSHEFLFPANESQTAFPWVPIPCQILESFGWVPSMSCHPDSGMPLGFRQLRPERDFRGTPYNHTWIPQKSIVEHFRALLRDFCFWANFLGFPIRKNLDLRRVKAYQKKTRRLVHNPIASNGHPEWFWMTKITA